MQLSGGEDVTDSMKVDGCSQEFIEAVDTLGEEAFTNILHRKCKWFERGDINVHVFEYGCCMQHFWKVWMNFIKSSGTLIIGRRRGGVAGSAALLHELNVHSDVEDKGNN